MYLLSIEDNISKILKTQKESLPLLSNAGVSKKFIDKQLNKEELHELKEQVLEQILKYEPRVSEADINLNASLDEVSIEIKNLRVVLN